MPAFRTGQIALLISTLALAPAFGSPASHVVSGHVRTASLKKAKKKVSHLHGQRVIDSARATEIQNALIQKKYLAGSASGQWDSQTQDAMRQYQSDHGWQTKLTPDSRALISLGLGPSHAQDVVQKPAVAVATPAVASTDQAQSTEPVANSLASVHSLAQ